MVSVATRPSSYVARSAPFLPANLDKSGFEYRLEHLDIDSLDHHRVIWSLTIAAARRGQYSDDRKCPNDQMMVQCINDPLSSQSMLTSSIIDDYNSAD
jgi:hypothetical protein